MPSYPLQTPQQPKGHLNPQMTPTSLPQSSQLPNPPTHPHHSSQPPQLHQPQMSTYSQLQQPITDKWRSSSATATTIATTTKTFNA
ncbi:hypothetical protein M0R45_023530 [Rubus argutus]|uniref:Uncharacterized protein n=1 Tax=Rubus argutus TaxID=59490 RepID=A0AAW1WPU2_RUBAR